MSSGHSESSRQRELDTYGVVDSLPETAYDDIVRLASVLCGAPIALVSLIDRDRQWLKARVGFELAETPRSAAFCDHVVRNPEQLMEIPDATRDPRFQDNPFVTGPDQVRFYAGMPLVTPSGAAVGTVCVLDREPRDLTDTQREALASLARLTMNLLEARHRERVHERAAVLAEAGAAEAAAVAVPAPTAPVARTVAVVELQDFAGSVASRGERAVERHLQDLETSLSACIDPRAGDSVSRVTGSPELILVLHGDEAAALQSVQSTLDRLAQDTSLQALCAASTARSAEERLDEVFLRADARLSALKDAARSPH